MNLFDILHYNHTDNFVKTEVASFDTRSDSGNFVNSNHCEIKKNKDASFW